MAFPPTWPIFVKKAESAPKSKKNQSLGQRSENLRKKLICASLCTGEKTTNCSLLSLRDAVSPLTLQGFRLGRLGVLFAARESSSKLRTANLANLPRRDGSTSQRSETIVGFHRK